MRTLTFDVPPQEVSTSSVFYRIFQWKGVDDYRIKLGLKSKDMVFINREDELIVSKSSLIDVPSAFIAARELIDKSELPTSIRWFEL